MATMGKPVKLPGPAIRQPPKAQQKAPPNRLCNKSLLKSSKDARQTFVWWAFVFGGVDGPP
jgi:hypothetical protein